MSGKRPPGRYPVDGKMLTVAEIAGLLETTVTGVRMRKSHLGGVSYQTMVDMYRAGQFGSRKTGLRKPCLIGGRWMSEGELAAELGVNPRALANWRCSHRRPDGTRPSMEEAVEHFRIWKASGHVRRWPKLHRVRGRNMSVKEAAAMLGVSQASLYMNMHKHRESLEAAVKRHEAWEAKRKARQAEKAIMEILGF